MPVGEMNLLGETRLLRWSIAMYAHVSSIRFVRRKMLSNETEEVVLPSFFILDPRRKKRDIVRSTLSPIGELKWIRMPPIGLFPSSEAWEVARLARSNSKHRNWTGLRRRITERYLAHLYDGCRRMFEKNDAVAVCWNGLNGARYIFMQAAKDAGRKTLYYELSPLPGRVTIDPSGVNFANCLPRTIEPYLNWAQSAQDPQRSWRQVLPEIEQRASSSQVKRTEPVKALEGSFIFVPLQTPGDSQLRLFGKKFRTVESFVESIFAASSNLPDGWHIRLKEHPTGGTNLEAIYRDQCTEQIIFDNVNDTFDQVRAARAVMTVNSSVGLEAMFFEKPVVACGSVFWRIDGVAEAAPDVDAMRSLFSNIEKLDFDKKARDAFLNFLDQVYYPSQTSSEVDLLARLQGKDRFGFWE